MDLAEQNFDVYQRFGAIQQILVSLGLKSGSSVLDVGGYPGTLADLLADAIPGIQVITTDLLVCPRKNYVSASADALPFADNTFEVVVSSDTLEHLAGDLRQRAINEALRVSRRWVIVGAPFRSPSVEFAETKINALHQKCLGKPNPWLTEHIQNILPELEVVREMLVSGGAAVRVFPNGAVTSWFTMEVLLLLMETFPMLSRLNPALNQHFNTLKSIFKKYKIRISLITSAKSKTDYGKTDLFIGTHSLIHKRVDFDNVAIVVIDEQHRFGVKQRAKLIKKSKNKKRIPHVLTMTATPIPRTIALTAYGDLDLSTLNELPKGRKPITTWSVPPQKRKAAFKWVENEVKKHSTQAFVVCPLIEESLTETMKSVKAATTEYEDLKNTLKSLKIGLMHGRQKSKEKENIIKKFKENKINILVTTPVVEVGIDIPNASIMIIEAAERFGLAQLHQLRGRVGRGEKRSYCLLFTEKSSRKSLARLDALKKEVSGFKLAEIDLRLRGPGEIYGLKQHGFPELRIASWNDFDLIRKAKIIAEDAFKQPDVFNKLFKFIFKDITLN